MASGGDLVVHLEGIKHGEAVVVHHPGRFVRLAQDIRMVEDLFALYRHQHDVRALPGGRFPQRLVAQVYV